MCERRRERKSERENVTERMGNEILKEKEGKIREKKVRRERERNEEEKKKENDREKRRRREEGERRTCKMDPIEGGGGQSMASRDQPTDVCGMW